VANPNDYSLFANSGWDGNWFVGYGNGWIKKLPAPPPADYAHAFLGAKLGRMKTQPPVGRPPEFNPIPGEIWMAIASTSVWTKAQEMKLTSTEDIPLDGSPEYALENIGESEWFWVEIPLSAVNRSGDNYLALWSPTPELISVTSAPVLAAAWGGKDINSWVVKDIKGEPPRDPTHALSTGISIFQPAMAIKLIPAGPTHPQHVRVVAWQNGTDDHVKPVITGSVEGESIERVWVEYKPAKREKDAWAPVGRSFWKAPYMFSLDQTKLPTGKNLLRLASVNIWEEKSVSEPVEIDVAPIHSKEKSAK
jgi:hypothetical protein